MKYLFFLLVTPFLLVAQAPDIQWQKAYGGERSDGGSTIIATKTGGYLLVGSSNSDIGFEKSEDCIGEGNASDIWIIKVNDIGTIEWQQTIGGVSNEGVYSALETRDGNYFIFGRSESPVSGDKTVPEYGYWLLKINTIGDIIWQRSFVDINSPTWPFEDLFQLTAVIETTDNGILFGGKAKSQPCCTFEEIPNRMAPTTNSKSNSSLDPECSGTDILLVKLDSSGNYLWEKVIKANYHDELKTINETSDGGFIIGAISNSTVSFDKTESSYIVADVNDCELSGYNNDFWILKTNNIGDIEWQKTIGGNNVDYLRSLHVNSDGYTLLGQSDSTISGDKTENNIHLTGDIWKVNLDLDGNIVSQNIIPLGSDYYNFIYHTKFVFNQNQGIYIDGIKAYIDEIGNVVDSIYELSKIDFEGNILWNRTINTIPNTSGIADLTFAPDGGVMALFVSESIVGGDKTEFCRGETDHWLVKFESETLANATNQKVSFSAFPNPTSNEVTITFNEEKEKSILKLYNVIGQLVSSNSFSNLQSISYPIVGEKGVYFLSVETDNSEKQTIKIIKK